MGGSEDKCRKRIREKVIPTCFLILMLLTMFLPFFEVKGIKVATGIHSGAYSERLTVIVTAVFLMATWKNRINGILRLFLQNTAILVMIIYDFLHLFFKYDEFKHVCIGFWTHIFVSIMMICYCSYCFYTKVCSQNKSQR